MSSKASTPDVRPKWKPRSASGSFNQPEASDLPARARAVAWMEWMATDFRWNPRWTEFTPILGPMLDQGRDQNRARLGIAPEAPRQEVVDALFTAADAMESGLPPEGQGRPYLAALVTWPPLPLAAAASSLAESELRRIDMSGRFNGGGGSSSGGSHR